MSNSNKLKEDNSCNSTMHDYMETTYIEGEFDYQGTIATTRWCNWDVRWGFMAKLWIDGDLCVAMYR